MKKVGHGFFAHYAEGNFKAALREIFTSPAVKFANYDTSTSGNFFLINFADSLVFQECLASRLLAAFIMQIGDEDIVKILTLDAKLIGFFGSEEAALEKNLSDCQLDVVEKSFIVLALAEKRGIFVSDDNAQKLCSNLDIRQKKLFAVQREMINAIYQLGQAKKSLMKVINGLERSFLPLSYPAPHDIKSIPGDIEGIPVVFMEALDIDWEVFLQPLAGRKAVFFFCNNFSFFHCLQFPAVIAALAEQKHLIYVLNVYPSEQFNVQPVCKTFKGPYSPVYLANEVLLQKFERPILDSLAQNMLQSYRDKRGDSKVANWLYHLGKKVNLYLRAEMLGAEHYLSLHMNQSYADLLDKHKALAPAKVDMGPSLPDYLGNLLDDIKPIAPKRAVVSTKKRIAHIVPQIVNGGHAPTRVLKSIVDNGDKEAFETFIVSTERLVYRPMEYPIAVFVSEPSFKRAAQSIQKWKSEGVNVLLPNKLVDFKNTAKFIAQDLSERKIDAAVFHGSDVINYLIAHMTEAPCRILCSHGDYPSHSGFDALIASETLSQERTKVYQDMDMEVFTNPFVVDCKEQWQKDPYPKSSFNLPEGTKILTTISNHLDSRLGEEMCLAIAEILSQCPKAYYLPIGEVGKKDELYKFFKKYGVEGHVRFDGPREDPSQCARSMDIYLNEFPVGSGIAVWEAMAAGCPVVTMYDKDGPAAARYGGQYFGIERAIISGKREDYVKLACSLINDKVLYEEWSKIALQRYEEYINPKRYAANFENIVLTVIEICQSKNLAQKEGKNRIAPKPLKRLNKR